MQDASERSLEPPGRLDSIISSYSFQLLQYEFSDLVQGDGALRSFDRGGVGVIRSWP